MGDWYSSHEGMAAGAEDMASREDAGLPQVRPYADSGTPRGWPLVVFLGGMWLTFIVIMIVAQGGKG